MKDAGRVLSIYQTFQHDKSAHEQPRYVDGTPSLFSWPEYQEYRDHNEVLSGLAAYAPFEATLDTATAARKVQGELVSCNYFAVLGKTPVLGRDFSLEDCKSRGASPYIILGQAFWKAKFAMNPNVLGSTVTVNRHPFTVIGIAGEAFAGTSMAAADFWAPMTMQQELRPRGTEIYLDNGRGQGPAARTGGTAEDQRRKHGYARGGLWPGNDSRTSERSAAGVHWACAESLRFLHRNLKAS